MRIIHSTTLLASPLLAEGRIGPFDLAGPNGEGIVDEFNFFRADYATLYARGRGARSFSFKVTALFTSEAAALFFLATHEDSLPQQADLTLIDDAETVALVMADAVVAVQIGPLRGCSLEVTYTFRGARFTSEDVPEDIDEDADLMKVINQALTEDAVSQAIAYDNPFASSPRGLNLTLSAPDGGTMISFQVRESTRTASGFTVDFDAPVPAAGYKLTGLAVL